MNRRLWLRSIAASSVATTAGCLDSLSSNEGQADDSDGSEREHADGAVLGPPAQDLSESSHPSYGDDVPSVELPNPLTGETVSTDQFENDRAVLMTFFYTSCPDGMCPALILRLRRAQEAAAANGYGEDVQLLAMTFDPERDTEDALRTFADQQGVDLEAGNWDFLRPERYETAKEILTDRIGLPLKKVDAEKYDSLEYQFPHYNLVLLANEDGIVERAYPRGATVEISRVVDDLETVVKA